MAVTAPFHDEPPEYVNASGNEVDHPAFVGATCDGCGREGYVRDGLPWEADEHDEDLLCRDCAEASDGSGDADEVDVTIRALAVDADELPDDAESSLDELVYRTLAEDWGVDVDDVSVVVEDAHGGDVDAE